MRPLARDGSSIWVLPWTAEIAKRAWITYLSQHRMPMPDEDLAPPVARALADARDARSRELEDACATELAGLPLQTSLRVRKHRAHRHGIMHLSGEIDLLCIDAQRSIIFVIEAKDPFVPLSARSIHRQITQFHEDGGYVGKLKRKADDIKASAETLAAAKGIERPDRDWQVVGVMVTRHLTPAAYMSGCPTTFSTVDKLRETIAHFGTPASVTSAAA